MNSGGGVRRWCIRLFLTHPITGRKVLYTNPGYTVRINELPEGESDEMLDYLFAFQLEPRFRHIHTWTENDLLVWDHLGTIIAPSPTMALTRSG